MAERETLQSSSESASRRRHSAAPVLRDVLAKLPAARFALAFSAVLAPIGLLLLARTGVAAAALGVLGAFAAFISLFLLSVSTSFAATQSLSRVFVLYATMLMLVISLSLIFSSVFFGWPLDLRRLATSDGKSHGFTVAIAVASSLLALVLPLLQLVFKYRAQREMLISFEEVLDIRSQHERKAAGVQFRPEKEKHASEEIARVLALIERLSADDRVVLRRLLQEPRLAEADHAPVLHILDLLGKESADGSPRAHVEHSD